MYRVNETTSIQGVSRNKDLLMENDKSVEWVEVCCHLGDIPKMRLVVEVEQKKRHK